MNRFVRCLLLFGGLIGNVCAELPDPSAASAENAPSPFQPGSISPEIVVPGKVPWSYHVYLPKEYSPDRKWPVLFILSPTGGNDQTLARYLDGAEMNNWILAVSVQSKNNFPQSQDAVRAMVGDVFRTLPVDPKRMYASGFSGGARMAFWLAEELKSRGFAGVLACGAGGTPAKMSAQTVVFGLCGSNCFNRWEMASTFKDLKNADSRLRFFPGNHDWALAPLLAYGMSWLNGCYLKSSAATPELAAEKQRFIAQTQDRIQVARRADPEMAYDWALCQSLALTPPSVASSPAIQELLNHPKVPFYVQGLKELDQFVMKHFAIRGPDTQNDKKAEAAKKDALALAEKYKDSRLAGLFARLGAPAVAPSR
ncbi:MAG: hypothetical protein U1E27_07680 [Kiritimatiellia bacterium]|nr:hypothetical protein [Kiritimatiellia bacterium]